MHIGLIGFGSIGRALFERLSNDSDYSLSALTRSGISDAPPELTQVATLDALLARRPELVVECAGHEAVHSHAEATLAAGVPLMIASLGALADASLAARLFAASRANGVPLILPSGAIGGLDLLRAISAEGAVEVRYQGIKPPAAWAGSPAEQHVELDKLTEATVFFEGSGREAATQFPKNANVVAALALAGAGFDTMRVALIADPAARTNTHRYEVTSPLCRYEMSIENAPSAGNARTSMTTVLSMLEEIRDFARHRHRPTPL